MTNPGNQGWRSGSAPKGDKKKKRDWRSDTARRGSAIRWGRILKFGGGFGAIVALVVAIILLFFVADETRVNVVALGPAEYSSLDVPLAGFSSGGLIEDWTGETSDQVFVDADADAAGSAFSVPSIIEDRSIIYVRAVAIGTRDGVLLCEKTAQPDTISDGQGGVLLKPLAEQLIKLKGRKLVLLDLTPVREHWRLGSVAVDFMSELRGLEDMAAKGRTIFLTASNVGERSWRSRTFGGQSVFRHFVQRGLRGEATESQYVRVSELAKYVTEQTKEWAFQRRESSPGQHPQCVPAVEKIDERLDFTLANVAVNKPLPSPDQPDSAAHMAELDELWKSRASWQGAAERSPVAWRTLTDQLLLQEQRVALGFPANTQVAKAALTSLQADPFRDALSANAWFKASVLSRLDGEATTEGEQEAGDISLAETVLNNNMQKWFNSRRSDADKLTEDEMEAAAALQKLAEESHARTVGIVPFVRTELDHADWWRRRAHDLLFTAREPLDNGVVETASNVTASHSEAVRTNEAASEAVNGVRAAYTAMLDSLATLPYLTQYAAGSSPPAQAMTVALKKTQDAKAARSLFEHPEAPRPTTAVTEELDAIDRALRGLGESAEIAKVFAMTRELAVRFAQFDEQKAQRELEERGVGGAEKATEHQVQKIVVLGADLAGKLKELKDRLTEQAETLRQKKEQANAQDHQKLVRFLRLPFLPADVRRDLFQRRIDFEASVAPAASGSAGEPDSDAWLVRGQWQAFWALQVRSLSSGTSDWLAAGDAPIPTWERLASIGESSDVYNSLVTLGRFLRSDLVNQQAALASEMEGRKAKSKLADRGERFRRADYLSRLLPSFEAKEVDPTADVQQFFVAEFALHYRNRIGLDFLRDATSNSDWYRQGVDAAQQLATKNGGARLAEFVMPKSAGSTYGVRLADRDTVQFRVTDTTKTLELSSRSKLPAGVSGIGAAWASPGAGASFELLSNGVPVALGEDGEKAALAMRPSKAGDACEPGGLPVDLFFRGHVGQRSFRVDPCTSPDLTVVTVPPPGIGAVRVEGRTQRAVVFVLDWSLSMLDGVPGSGKKRYQVALDAIETALRDLDDDDQVGFVIFGHRVYLVKQVGDDQELDFNEEAMDEYAKAGGERPTALKDAQLLVSLKALSENRASILDWLGRLRTVDKLKPYGNTPLYTAIDLAADQLANESGGAIIVVTDGEPDYPEPPRGLARRLEAKNIATRAVQFTFSKPLRLKSALPVEASAKNLGAKIREAIPPKEYTVVRSGAEAQPTRVELNQTKASLRPGKYTIGFGQGELASEIDVVVGGGELHRFVLQQGKFVRDPAPMERLVRVPGRDAVAPEPTRLGHTNFRIRNRTAELTIALDHERRDLPVVWPREIGLQLIPEGRDVAITDLRIEFVRDRPVPTYLLKTDGWPAEVDQARVKAWWNVRRTRHEAVVSGKDLRKPGDLGVVRVSTVGGLPTLSVSATGDATLVKIRIKVLPGGDKSIKGLRVEPGLAAGEEQFTPIRVRETKAQYWLRDGVADFEFRFEDVQSLGDLVFALTSGEAMQSEATKVEDASPRNADDARNDGTASP